MIKWGRNWKWLNKRNWSLLWVGRRIDFTHFIIQFPLLSLPDEIIGYIFSFVSIKDRMKARLCKRLDKIEVNYKYYLPKLVMVCDEVRAIEFGFDNADNIKYRAKTFRIFRDCFRHTFQIWVLATLVQKSKSQCLCTRNCVFSVTVGTLISKRMYPY